MIATKRCPLCHEEKPLDEMVHTSRDGYTVCKPCEAARSRARRAAHRDEINARDRQLTAQRQAANLCTQCGEPARPGRRTCPVHHAHEHRRTEARRKVKALLDYAASLGFEAGLTCAICFAAPGVEVDHYVSIEDGGSDEWANLRRVCHPCNAARPPEPDPVNILMQVASYTSPEFAEAAAAHVTARRARRRPEAEHYDAVARRIADELLGH